MKKKLIIISGVLVLLVIVGIFIKVNFVEQRIAILTYHGVLDEVEDKDG